MQNKLKGKKSSGAFSSRKNKPQKHRKLSHKQQGKLTKIIRDKIERKVADRAKQGHERLKLVKS